MNFGRTTQHRCWMLPSSVKFWVTTYDAEENLEKLLDPLGKDDHTKRNYHCYEAAGY